MKRRLRRAFSFYPSFVFAGMLVYFVYGYHNSIEGNRPKTIELELDPIPGIPVIETNANLPTKLIGNK